MERNLLKNMKIGNTDLMFGSYNIPLKIEEESLVLSFDKEEDLYFYKREHPYGTMEKVLLLDTGKILINPIEPLNTPKDITSNLLIEFERSIVVGPKVTKKIFITFPVEIGIFISGNKNFEVLDVFTLVYQKFTLYGDPRNGLICKYWKSEVYSSIPTKNPIFEGIIELNIINDTLRWIEVNKAVFNAYYMKIYYNDVMVSMKAKMKIIGEEMAETDFINSPLITGLKKSTELYTTKKVSVIGQKFLMEAGI